MSNLIEVVFEDFPIQQIPQALMFLTKEGMSVKDYHIQGDITYKAEIDWTSSQSISEAIDAVKEGAIFVNLSELDIGSIIIPRCALQVLAYEDSNNLNVTFLLEHITDNIRSTLIQNLMVFSKQIADLYGVKNYFAGLDPAVDKETRLFTQQKRGPLTL